MDNMMEKDNMICSLCPRHCMAERNAETGKGFCGMGYLPRIARIAPHYWEEPCISGTRGSGTVFFSGCTLGCVYCQNHSISHLHQGKNFSIPELAEAVKKLEETGVHNISYVTATQFTEAVIESLKIYTPKVPIVWNTSGYETVETLKKLENKVSIYLPDIKYVSSRLSRLLSGAPDYFEAVSAAVLEMIRQTGTPEYDDSGIMIKGTVIRHLVLPGCTADSMHVLDWIAENLPSGTPVSIMRQYTPIPECTVKGMDRRITDAEYDRVTEHAVELGLNALVQEKESARDTFIPDFDLKD